MKRFIFFLPLCLLVVPLFADEGDTAKAKTQSPWIFVPTLTSDPKLGATVGAIVGYLHKFDEQSSPSTFLLLGNYSASDSYYGGVFSELYFDNNHQKLMIGYASGKVNNDYDDFLGTGLPAQTTDTLESFGGRYTRHVSDGWNLGGQVISTNYMLGVEEFLDHHLEHIRQAGFDSTGVGIVAEYDSRDNKRNARTGRYLVLHNIAYRESLGGTESFDVYYGEFNHYLSFGSRNVLATQFKGRWTSHDTPKGGQSSVALRGYVRGMHLAENYSHLSLDGRFALRGPWGLSVFGGAGCLYDRSSDCSSSDNRYPAIGGGLIYVLREVAGIVLRLEYAVGKDDNHGFYLTLGNPY
ncbi:MAG TPA: hypothetical protein DES72_13865 [Gammaproteobacteria bacterium]|nr:hypothetical protein [Gammaproteobacteria bacterium]|tara:strand:+ start:36309 stop:37364 length:1056 start_codon:yes stop_codon:yes gene_type:complete